MENHSSAHTHPVPSNLRASPQTGIAVRDKHVPSHLTAQNLRWVQSGIELQCCVCWAIAGLSRVPVFPEATEVATWPSITQRVSRKAPHTSLCGTANLSNRATNNCHYMSSNTGYCVCNGLLWTPAARLTRFLAVRALGYLQIISPCYGYWTVPHRGFQNFLVHTERKKI
jgi:hypothetical protein